MDKKEIEQKNEKEKIKMKHYILKKSKEVG